MTPALFNLSNHQFDFLLSAAHAAGNIIIVVIIMVILLKSIRRIITLLKEKQTFSPPLIFIFHSSLRWMVYISAALIVLQQAGVKISSLWTLLTATAAMVAIGFVAVWSVLSNLLCTLMLILFRPFQIGDTIEIIDPSMTSGVKGRVRNINLLFSTLYEPAGSTQDGWETHIPNNLFFQKIIRRKAGGTTFSLDKQLFEKESLLKNSRPSDAAVEKG